MPQTVDVKHLQIGMYVHLDLGWMSHPFALSSFRIETKAQIDTIRALGVRQVRWEPEKSQLGASLGAAAAPSPPPAADESAATIAARQRRERLAAQRASSARCERLCAEAAAALQGNLERALQEPQASYADTRALASAMVDKMQGDVDICVHLLTTGAGDRAAAHALNVALISLLMGRRMGMSAHELVELGVGAMLHDVGKQGLADRVRHADGLHSISERADFRSHVERGVALGRRMGLGDTELAVLAQHHEMADGSGFPDAINGDQMTPAARIVAIVNRYDNLCNPPAVSNALTPHQALSQLFAQNRGEFDSAVLNTLIRMMGVYPAGSVVQLTDDRYALVVESNATRPLKPRVLVFDPRVARDEALLLDLESTPNLGIRRSLVASTLPPPALDYLAPRLRVAYYFEPIAPAQAA